MMIKIKNLMRHDTDKVEEGLMVLFFGLVFPLSPFPLKIFLPMPM